jgi:deoxyribodipyrimidine photo-lyase
LIIRQGPAQSALQSLREELGDVCIYAHEDFSPFARQRDQAIAEAMTLNRYPGVLYQHPQDILKDDGDPYVVYTPFKQKWYLHPLPTPADCLPAPDDLPPTPENLISLDLPHGEPVADFPATAQKHSAG